MSKTRKLLTTLTMVAVTTTVSLTAVSSAEAHFNGRVHSHFGGVLGSGPIPVPGVGAPAPGTVVTTPVPGFRAPVPGPVLPGVPGVADPAPPTPATPAPPRRRGGLRRGEAAALGVLGGVLIGSVLANSRRTAQPAPAATLPVDHYIYCDDKYRSYVAATNTFTGYDGRQHYCISPFVR